MRVDQVNFGVDICLDLADRRALLAIFVEPNELVLLTFDCYDKPIRFEKKPTWRLSRQVQFNRPLSRIGFAARICAHLSFDFAKRVNAQTSMYNALHVPLSETLYHVQQALRALLPTRMRGDGDN